MLTSFASYSVKGKKIFLTKSKFYPVSSKVMKQDYRPAEFKFY